MELGICLELVIWNLEFRMVGCDAHPCTKDRAAAQHLWEASLALAPLDEGIPSERIQSENT